MILCGCTEPGMINYNFIATSITIPMSSSIAGASAASVNVKKESRVQIQVVTSSACSITMGSNFNCGLILCGCTPPGMVLNNFIATSKTIPLAVSLAGVTDTDFYLRKNSRVQVEIETPSQSDLELKSRKNIRATMAGSVATSINVKAKRNVLVVVDGELNAVTAVRKKTQFDAIVSKFVDEE